ncbi:glycosyltransferase [Myxacorys almedinensis]|uniref:Glycosyltransferase n=1 Tax=Myxacorys almedinensis A TaxID=2690445 RepID=A0A8J7Z192_9CYAN|nr:glycosyltransferase [Myxacorys almedinensis]NDJ16298.1 glycosyltransferase [Myxacorys almedinensis A]
MNELGLAILSLVIWIYLLGFRGWFWRTDQQLREEPIAPAPSVCVVVPARDEADFIAVTMRSLLTQRYPGSLTIFLVDDHSRDRTADIAKETAISLGQSHRLHIIAAASLPPGWTGKLWALEQGIQQAMAFQPDYVLLTDADIEHEPTNLSKLVAKAVNDDRELVSLMVRLRCESFWENLLIPAFVFFFAKLYPFRWSNQPTSAIAAAAGGCSLIRREALVRIGGMEAIRQALIDDCALAHQIKFSGSRRIWLGLASATKSLRPYDSLDTIWTMVARTAYTQLQYSPFLLLGTVVGLILVYLIPIVSLVVGAIVGNAGLALVGLLTYALMTISYLPIIKFYNCSLWFGACLPAIASLYLLMTMDSAVRHWRGQGGAWKGRVYNLPDSQQE